MGPIIELPPVEYVDPDLISLHKRSQKEVIIDGDNGTSRGRGVAHR